MPPTTPVAPLPGTLTPFPGALIHPGEPTVELRAWVCLNAGWLEQIACAPATREHEALIVPLARPSQIHAALLMAGFQHGSPGAWYHENDEYTYTPPTGDAVHIWVRYETDSGSIVEEPIRNWIRDHDNRHQFPDAPWIFTGSLIEPNPEWMDPGEHYVADITGSIIGLVTFGDEVLGFSHVLADQAAVLPPQWVANTDRIPPVGTEVTLILRPAPPKQ